MSLWSMKEADVELVTVLKRIDPNRPTHMTVALVVSVALAVAAGCGGGSSKPAYCSDRSALESSVKGLTVPTSSSDISALKSQVATIQSDANALVQLGQVRLPKRNERDQDLGGHAHERREDVTRKPLYGADRSDRTRCRKRRQLRQELHRRNQLQVQLATAASGSTSWARSGAPLYVVADDNRLRPGGASSPPVLTAMLKSVKAMSSFRAGHARSAAALIQS